MSAPSLLIHTAGANAKGTHLKSIRVHIFAKRTPHKNPGSSLDVGGCGDGSTKKYRNKVQYVYISFNTGVRVKKSGF